MQQGPSNSSTSSNWSIGLLTLIPRLSPFRSAGISVLYHFQLPRLGSLAEHYQYRVLSTRRIARLLLVLWGSIMLPRVAAGLGVIPAVSFT